MSGPYCGTCEHFSTIPFSADYGECDDPSKKIYDRNGNIAINEHISVHNKFECCNYTTAKNFEDKK